LKNPCAKQVLDDLINDDLTGQIANIIQNLFGSTTQVNLDFEESTTTQGNAPTASSPPVVANGIFNDKITLNSSQIAGSSKEYLASIMIHEVLHAYLSYNGVAQNQLLQHQNIALNYVSGIRDLLQQEYDISSEDANCLIIEGLSDLQSNPLYSNFYNNLLSSLNLTTGLIQTTSLLYKEGINGTSCGN
jgi:predicted SprT family Zn-dependent metalloprotease